jgi:hypothetical protein
LPQYGHSNKFLRDQQRLVDELCRVLAETGHETLCVCACTGKCGSIREAV